MGRGRSSAAAQPSPYLPGTAVVPWAPPAPAAQSAYQLRRPPTGLARPMGPCLACGEMGHIRSFCPKTSLMEGKKWYSAPRHVLPKFESAA